MFFCKQKTEYEVRIRYWSSDVCSSDLALDAWVLDPWKFHQFAADCRQIDARHRHVALPQHTLIDALFVHAFGAGHADFAHSKPCIDCNRRHMRPGKRKKDGNAGNEPCRCRNHAETDRTRVV